MTISGATFERARRLALTVLSEVAYPTPDDVGRAVDAAVAASQALGEHVDGQLLRKQIESDVSVFVGQATMLDDPDSAHEPWLDARRGALDWRFWLAYRDW